MCSTLSAAVNVYKIKSNDTQITILWIFRLAHNFPLRFFEITLLFSHYHTSSLTYSYYEKENKFSSAVIKVNNMTIEWCNKIYIHIKLFFVLFWLLIIIIAKVHFKSFIMTDLEGENLHGRLLFLLSACMLCCSGYFMAYWVGVLN